MRVAPAPELILGIESSCDETAAAIVQNGRTVLSNIISSQIDIHQKFGGVVPEIASRKHIEMIDPVIQESLDSCFAWPPDVALSPASLSNHWQFTHAIIASSPEVSANC